MNIIISDNLRQNIIDNFFGEDGDCLYLIFSATSLENSSRSTLPAVENMKLAVRIRREFYALKKSYTPGDLGFNILVINGIEYYITENPTGFESYNWNSAYVRTNIPAIGPVGLYDTVSIVARISAGPGSLQDYYTDFSTIDFSNSYVVAQYRRGYLSEISGTSLEEFNALLLLENEV